MPLAKFPLNGIIFSADLGASRVVIDQKLFVTSASKNNTLMIAIDNITILFWKIFIVLKNIF